VSAKQICCSVESALDRPAVHRERSVDLALEQARCIENACSGVRNRGSLGQKIVLALLAASASARARRSLSSDSSFVL